MSVRQGKSGRQFADALAHLGERVQVLDVHQHLADHVGDGGHLWLAHSPGGYGRRAEPDAAGLERRAGLEWNRVLVNRDTGFVKHRLAFLAAKAARAYINKHQMVVRAPTDE